MVPRKAITIATVILLCVVIANAQPADTAYFWAGGYFDDDYIWHDTMQVDRDQWVDIPIYYCGGPDVWIAVIYFPLGANYEVIDSFNVDGCSWDYWPFNGGEHGWDTKEFTNYNSDVDVGQPVGPNPEGFHSLSFVGWARNLFPGGPWLHSETLIQILSFRVHIANNNFLRGQTVCGVLTEGVDPHVGGFYAGDTLGGPGYIVADNYACLRFPGTPQFGSLSGVVSDINGVPVESVQVSIESDLFGNVGEGFTGEDGSYLIPDLPYCNCIVSFNKTGYLETIEETTIEHSVNILDATMYLPAEEEVVLWAGTLDGSPIKAPIGEWMDIPVYCQTSANMYIASINYPLGAKMTLIDSFDATGCSWDYWPFNSGEWGWGIKEFTNYNDDQDHGYPQGPNPAGYHSLTFFGFWSELLAPADWLHSEVPIHILDFRVHVADDSALANNTYSDALAAGIDPVQGPANCHDTLGTFYVILIQYFSPVRFIAYEYVLGDANMYLGTWPPVAIGGDVTYLVNYFRSIPSSQPCPIDGFWASADVNGDCAVIGSDVTRLVNYFKGNIDIDYCPDYPSMWPTPGDIPDEPPEGWPNCE